MREILKVILPSMFFMAFIAGCSSPDSRVVPETVVPETVVPGRAGGQLPSEVDARGTEWHQDAPVQQPRVFMGTPGDDAHKGGPERNWMFGGGGKDMLEGGAGDDVLDGGDGDDSLFGDEGDDILRGGAGNDVLDGRIGDDSLDGGPGDDILEGWEGDDHLQGGAGNDTLDGGDHSDRLEGGPGNDDLDGADDDDVLIGGMDDDLLDGGDGNDVLHGGQGMDSLFGRDGADTLLGGPGDDVLVGGDGPDLMQGGVGDDLLSGGDGVDTLRGDAGEDDLRGGNGIDHLMGGKNDDLLLGQAGNDVLDGGEGNDWLLGGLGTDAISAGDGDDTVLLRAGDVEADGIEHVSGGPGMDTLVLNGFSAGDLTTGDGFVALSDPLTGGRYLLSGFESTEFASFFPQFGNGGGETSTLVLVNPSAAETATGTVELWGEDGTPWLLSLNGRPGVEKTEFTIPPRGSIELSSDGEGEARSGGVRVVSDRPVGGMVRAFFPGLGRTGVPESRLLDFFVVPVGVHGQLRDGLAVVNGSVESPLAFEDGPDAIDLVPKGQRVTFLDGLLPSYSRPGSPQVYPMGGGPAAVAAILVGPDPGQLATAPVLPLFPPLADTFYVPHVTSGNGRSSTIILVNISRQQGARAQGELVFLGEDGVEVAIDVDGFGPVTRVPFDIGPPARAGFFATNSEGALRVASIRGVVKSGILAGMVHLTFPGGRPVGLVPRPPLQGFVSPVRGKQTAGMTTVLTLQSTGATVTAEVVLRDPTGAEIAGGTAVLQLPPKGRVARSLEELFPTADTADFKGTMTVRTTGGAVSAAVFELGEGRATVLPMIRLP